MLTGTREEKRDQLVTLLAAGHETTATALAWALERLARHPTELDTDEQIDAFVREVLRTRPVLSITARRVLQPYTLGEYTLPPGVYVAPCIYLAHRRTDTFIPFGGGVRRCVGAVVRHARDARGAACRRRPVHARARAGRRRAHASPQRHAGARARRLDHPFDPLAWTPPMPGMFCRHNRLTSKCPICSRELQEELRSKTPVRHVTPRKPGASSTPRGPQQLGPLERGRDAQARARRRRRLPQPAGARPARDRRRRAARDRAHRRRRPAGAARAVPADRRRARPRAGDVDGVPVRARARSSRTCSRRPTRRGRTPTSRRCRRRRPRPPPPTARGSSAPGSQEAAFTGEDRGRRRAASAASSSGSRCPASTAPPATAC